MGRYISSYTDIRQEEEEEEEEGRDWQHLQLLARRAMM